MAADLNIFRSSPSSPAESFANASGTAANPQSALVIGKRNRWLPRWVLQQLNECSIPTQHAPHISEAIRSLRSGDGEQSGGNFDLIVLAQERPGELPRNLHTRIREAAPSAALLSVAGSWCEGELRTGNPWEAIERIYWHEFSSWLDRKVTASGPRKENSIAKRSLIAINALHRESASAISDCLQSENEFASVWLPRVGPQPLASGYDAAIWVGGQLTGSVAFSLAAFCQQMRNHAAPVLAMLDFPRADEWQLARQLGVAALLGKPWDATALCNRLSQLCHDRQETNATPSTLPLRLAV